MQILNAAAYRFVPLDDLPGLRANLIERALYLGLKGTILLAPEGINLFLAGAEDELERFLALLLRDRRFAGMPVKRSYSEEQPFNRMLVKIKREIIALRRPDIDPARNPAPRLDPRELKRWLDEGRELLLLDTRNRFEVELGTFDGAAGLQLNSFSELPRAAERIDPRWRERPVVTFCTGGIRCEKAAPLLLDLGFREVVQLDGGLLKYFEDCGGAHFSGECFVFDKRVALDSGLKQTGTTQCYACQAVVPATEQRSPDYIVGVSCPHCKRDALAA
ncbi:MAG: sulfurtransferase [Burkholderiales bacterium]